VYNRVYKTTVLVYSANGRVLSRYKPNIIIKYELFISFSTSATQFGCDRSSFTFDITITIRFPFVNTFLKCDHGRVLPFSNSVHVRESIAITIIINMIVVSIVIGIESHLVRLVLTLD
jgi:hypothetical protein